MQVNSGSEAGWRPTPTNPALAPQLALTSSDPAPESDDTGFQPFGGDGLGFFDFLDIINPLHHLPFVGPLYREMTGDELSAGPRMMGSTLYFGPIGLVGSAVDVVLEEITGDDLGGNIMTVLGDGNADDNAETSNAGAEVVEAPRETVSLSAGAPTAAGTDSADPVTAWAMAELNYRQSQAEKQGLNIPAKSYSHLLVGTSVAATHPDDIRRANTAYRAVSLLSGPPPNEQPGSPEPQQESPRSGSDTGAIASNGGWFTATMLGALAKSHPDRAVEPTAPTPQGSPSGIN